jgi:hypothetical protein
MEVLSIYADAMRERLAFPEPFLLTNRKSQQFQIINRFKNFESCLNRLDVCKTMTVRQGAGRLYRILPAASGYGGMARLNGRATFCT